MDEHGLPIVGAGVDYTKVRVSYVRRFLDGGYGLDGRWVKSVTSCCLTSLACAWCGVHCSYCTVHDNMILGM